MTPRWVLVNWLDSGGSEGWEHTEEAIHGAATDPMECESVGWLLADTDKYVLLAPSRKAEDEVMNALQIPRCAIIGPIITLYPSTTVVELDPIA
jgi:hypothetical protein